MSNFNFAHLNVRSLTTVSDTGPRLQHIQDLLLSRWRCDVFACTETHLDKNIDDSRINIPSYSVIRKDRTREGGGCAIYVANPYPFLHRFDFEVNSLELIWVEIHISPGYKCLFGVCYRPPNQSAAPERRF